MKLQRINYSELNSRQREIYNFQKVAALLAEYGFNCIKLSDDWQGADFLAYHKDGKETLKGMALTLACRRDHDSGHAGAPERAAPSAKGKAWAVVFAFAARCVPVDGRPYIERSA